MTEYTYKITGNLTYNDADTEDGFATVEIEDFITVEEMSAEKALELFLQENECYDFFGKLTQYDADTRGKKWSLFRDQNEGQTIRVEYAD